MGSSVKWTLTTLPFDVFQQIALNTIDPSIPGPPKQILNLLLTCRSIYDLLRPSNNPGFYGQLFDLQFDTAALRRRFHPSRLTALCRAAELQKRWIALKRIKQYARGKNAVWGYPGFSGVYLDPDKLSDAWLAWLMITEDDGQNLRQLGWARIIDWTRSFIHYDIHAISVRSQQSGQLPTVSHLRALGLNLYWMTTKFDDIMNEPTNALSKVNRMLRPFTFASWAYPSFLAPWQLCQIPPPTSYAPPTPSLDTGTPAAPPSFYRSNFLPPTVVIESYLGAPLPMTPPLVNHAAVCLFFTRMQRFRIGEEAALPEDKEALKAFRAANGPNTPYTPEYSRTKFVYGERSDIWDEDVIRLGEVCRTLKSRSIWRQEKGKEKEADGDKSKQASAADSTESLVPPSLSPLAIRSPLRLPSETPEYCGMKRYRYQPGTFAGEWEGRFVIYGLDALQNVMEGTPALQALESTVLTQDPQAWRIREYHHPSILPLHLIPPIRAEKVKPPIRPAASPLGAFLPHNLPVHHVKGGVEVGRDESFYVQVGKDGREVVPADEGCWADKEPSADDLKGKDDIEIIIEGESIQPLHAVAGGQTMMEPGSKVVGTIRRWDGLITLLATPKNLNPNANEPSRRKWLYRGYVLSNGNWVGRWRDTWNDVNTEGYEGVFVMNRRQRKPETISASSS